MIQFQWITDMWRVFLWKRNKINGWEREKLLTQLVPGWPLPRLWTVYLTKSVGCLWKDRGQQQQKEWLISHSPLGQQYLSGLLHTEGLMVTPRWWEGCKQHEGISQKQTANNKQIIVILMNTPPVWFSVVNSNTGIKPKYCHSFKNHNTVLDS